MSLYVLVYKCPAINDVTVYKMPDGSDKAGAARLGRTTSEDYGVQIVETSDDLQRMSGPLMVKLYNELIKERNERNKLDLTYAVANPVTKFQDSQTGRNRLYREIVDAAVVAPANMLITADETARDDAAAEPPLPPEPALSQDQLTTIMAGASSDNATSQETTMATQKKTARKKVNGDQKITLLVDENPKRKGTEAHKRFGLYKNGMLVSTFLEKGGSSADLRWDVKNKFIKVG